jgi:hypothetical protein
MDRRRILTMSGVGVVLIGTIATAAWLTFVRGDTSMAAMDMSMDNAAAMTNHNMHGAAMSASSCALVSPTALNKVLGTIVQAPSATSSQYETACTYPIAATGQTLTIRYSMKISRDAFNATVPQEVSSKGNLTRHICSVGDTAYWGTVGSGATKTTVLAVLKGQNQMVISGSLTPNEAQQIAKAALPSL